MLKGSSFNNEVVDSNARATNAGGISEAQNKANALHSRITGSSFELVPSSYKEGTLYSGTGVNGDLSFTRAGDAWRTNEQGLIQRVPWNLALQSQTLNSSSWIMFTGPAVTPNSTTAPDGTLTADTINSAGGANDFLYQSASLTIGVTYTMSFYVKNLNSTACGIWTNNGGIFYINWSGLTLTSITSFTSPGVFSSVGNGWYRVSATFTYTGGANNNRIYPDSAATSKSIYVWGYQLVEGTNPLPYFPTTDRLSVPRLDYSNGSSPSLLLEPQRTNLVFPSVPDNTWNKIEISGATVTITPNYTLAPDGTNTGTKVVFSIFSSLAQICKQFTNTLSTYNTSIWIKVPSGTVTIRFGYYDGISVVDTVDKVITTTWQRIDYTRTFTTTSGVSRACWLYGNGSTVNQEIHIWGGQLEVGAYPSTYIRTTTASVTRLVDGFSRSNFFTNGIVTAAGGTWLIEFKNNISYTRDAVGWIQLEEAIGSNLQIRFGNVANRILILKTISGANSTLYTTTTTTAKILFKWNGTSVDVFVNGVKVVTASPFTITNFNTFNSTSSDAPRYIQQMALFPTPLSDTDCINLTSDYTDGSSITGNYEQYVNNLGGTVENLNGVTNLIQNLK